MADDNGIVTAEPRDREILHLESTAEPEGNSIAARVRQLQARLIVAESRFEDIARLVSDWIWETDREFRFSFVSRRIGEILDRHPREWRGADLFVIGQFAARDGVSSPALDRTSRSPFRDAPYRVRTRDGEARLFQLSGVPVFDDRTGAFLGYRGTARDVTDETEARADANRSQTRLRDAVESISEGFILYDRAGRLVICNRRIRDYWYAIAHRLVPGARVSTLIRAGARMVAHPGPDEFVKTSVRRRTRDEMGLEVRLKDGRWLRITDRAMSDGSTVSIHADITAAKQREEALSIAKNTAEAANRAKSAFLANMSHELRTPLNAIIGFSEVMRDNVLGPIGNPAYEGYITNVVECGQHLLSVINDILDVAKAESGKLALEEGEVSLAATVASVARLVAERVSRQNVELVVQPLEHLPTLVADELRLKQILINLLSNAIKFTEAGGRVEVRAEREPEGGLRIIVADTGIGIAPEHIGDALTPFGQVDNNFNRKFHGTGLGLPLTRAFAELHGGTLEIDSEPGVGTRVTVRLPKSRVLAAPESGRTE